MQHAYSVTTARRLGYYTVYKSLRVPKVTSSLLMLMARQTPIDMSLPGHDSPLHKIRLMRRKRWYRFRRLATRGLALALVLMLTVGGLLFSQSYLKLHKIFRGTTGTAAALKPNPNMLKGENQGQINILLLGRDGGNHKNPNLTNTIMLMSIDPINYRETLISLPSSLWVNVPNAGLMKLNAVWRTGELQYIGKQQGANSNDPSAVNAGFALVDQAASQILGVNIDYNALVNFQAFEQAVNTVGGITVSVPTNLVDPTMAWQNGNNPVLAQAGTEHFDGAQALAYAMSEETTSSFARDSRQRAVLTALEQKIETIGTLGNPLKVSSLINELGNNVQTDLSLRNASRLFGIIQHIPASSITQTDMATPPHQYFMTGNAVGQAIVLPSAGLFNYSAIHAYVQSLLKNPFILKENASVVVLNGTLINGLAAKTRSTLQTLGYDVMGIGNAPNSNWSHTTLIDMRPGKDVYTEQALEKLFGVNVSTKLPHNIATNNANFVIILGNNEAHSPQP